MLSTDLIPVQPRTFAERFYHFILGRPHALRRLPGRLCRRTTREWTLLSLAYSPLHRTLFREMSDGLKRLLEFCGGNQPFEASRWKAIVLGAFKEFSIQKRLGAKEFVKALHSLSVARSYCPATTGAELRSPRLKILFVTGMFPSTEHAGGLRLFDTLTHLSKRHEIDLYSIYSEKMDFNSLHLMKDKLNRIRLVREKYFSVEEVEGWLTAGGIEPQYYDVIHFEYNHTIPLIDGLRKWGKKTVFVMTECLSKSSYLRFEDALKNGADEKERGRLLARVLINCLEEKKGHLHASVGVAVTPEDASFIERIAHVKPEVIPTGISDFAVYDRVKMLKNAEPEKDSAMFLGFFDHHPNIEAMQWYLRDVHPLVRQKIPSFKFYVVGAGRTDILKTEFGSDSSIEITGRVDDFVPYIARAKVCISPLISGSGFRGKINQYSAVGRPTVSTSLGVAGVKYQHQNSVFVADDPQAFAAGMVELLTDDRYWASMAKNAAKIAEKEYSWSPLIERLERLYAR